MKFITILLLLSISSFAIAKGGNDNIEGTNVKYCSLKSIHVNCPTGQKFVDEKCKEYFLPWNKNKEGEKGAAWVYSCESQ